MTRVLQAGGLHELPGGGAGGEGEGSGRRKSGDVKRRGMPGFAIGAWRGVDMQRVEANVNGRIGLQPTAAEGAVVVGDQWRFHGARGCGRQAVGCRGDRIGDKADGWGKRSAAGRMGRLRDVKLPSGRDNGLPMERVRGPV